MEPNQLFTKFIDQLRPGQIYRTYGGDIAVVIDVLRSAYTPNVAIYARFVRNIGNARQYDILEVNPEKHLGVMDWQPATFEDLALAIQKREAGLVRELAGVLKLNSRQAPG